MIVKSSSVGLEENDRILMRDIQKHVELHKARHKWLKGGEVRHLFNPQFIGPFCQDVEVIGLIHLGVQFIDVIPKSPSGKILRRLLRDQDRKARRLKGPRL